MRGKRRKRRSIRLPNFDYGQAGAYFVTICVDGRKCVLGGVVDGEMQLSTVGEIVDEGWRWLAGMFESVEVPIHCVLPNHTHAIIAIQEVDQEEESYGRGGVTPPLPMESDGKRPNLGKIVARYKYETTKQINQLSNTPSALFWQRNYYERVIRNEREFEAIYDYIEANPVNWEADEEYRPG